MADLTEKILLQVDLDINPLKENIAFANAQIKLLIAEQEKLQKSGKSNTTEFQILERQIGLYAKQVADSTKALAINANLTTQNTRSLAEQRVQLTAMQLTYKLYADELKQTSPAAIKLNLDILELSESIKAQELSMGTAVRNVGNYKDSIGKASHETKILRTEHGLTANVTNGLTSAMQLLAFTQGQSADKSKSQKIVEEALTGVIALQGIQLGIAAGKDLALTVSRSAATAATNAYGVAVKVVTAITTFFGQASAAAWAAATLGLSVLITGIVLLISNWERLFGAATNLKDVIDKVNKSLDVEVERLKLVSDATVTTIESHKQLVADQIALAQAQGKSIAEIQDLKQKALNDDKAIATENIKVVKDQYDAINAIRTKDIADAAALRAEGGSRADKAENEDRAALLDEDAKLQQDKLDKLKINNAAEININSDFLVKQSLLNQQGINDQKEFSDKKQKEAADAAQKLIDSQKKADSEYFASLNAQFDAYLNWWNKVKKIDEDEKKAEIKRQEEQGKKMIAQGGMTQEQIAAESKAWLAKVIADQLAADKQRLDSQQASVNAAATFAGSLFTINENFLQTRIQQIEEEEQSGKISKEKAHKEIAALKRKEAIANKEEALFNLGVNLAQAIIKITAQTGIYSPAAIALEIGLAAAQAAAIISRPIPAFAQSGITGKRITSRDGIPIQRSNGDNMLATVRTGEVILNEQHQRMLGGAATFKAMGVPGFAQGGILDGGLAFRNATPDSSNLDMLSVLDLIADKSPVVRVVDINTVQNNVARVEQNANI